MPIPPPAAYSLGWTYDVTMPVNVPLVSYMDNAELHMYQMEPTHIEGIRLLRGYILFVVPKTKQQVRDILDELGHIHVQPCAFSEADVRRLVFYRPRVAGTAGVIERYPYDVALRGHL